MNQCNLIIKDVENEDGRWLITGTKAEIKQYIAQQIYKED